MVGATRFERATSSTPWKRATKLRHAPTQAKRIPKLKAGGAQESLAREESVSSTD